jgi:hypothetical protein
LNHNNNLGTDKNRNIGRSIVTKQFPSTMDLFWFVIDENVIANPFDFVSVDNINNSISVGIIKDIQSILVEENPFPLEMQKSMSHDSDMNENSSSRTYTTQRVKRIPSTSAKNVSNVMTVAKVAIIANTGNLNHKDEIVDNNIASSINMPIKLGKIVRFANPDQIMFALGIPEMKHPIPAGIIEMPNGIQIPISLDITYIAGPDTAHVNVSGISGNQKTTYLLFLLQSTYQTLLTKFREKAAIVIFNLKEDDLLHIDKKPPLFTERQKKIFNSLDLKLDPFENVTYFLPRGNDGMPNSAFVSDLNSSKSSNFKTYSYELRDIYDRLDLLFPDLNDPRYNLLSIADFIHETWPTLMMINNPRTKSKMKTKTKQKTVTWSDLLKYDKFPQSVIPNKTSLLHFRSHIQKLKNSSIFVDRKVTSTYLGNEVLNIKSGNVYVIDLGMISSIPEQSFVIGDIMKTVDQMFSSADFTYSQGSEKTPTGKKEERPQYLFVFIDEINRFSPSSHTSLPKIKSSSSEHIMKTIISGASRGIVLFSAQQFKSATDLRLHDNTGLHVTAKLGLSELSKPPYADLIDENIKSSITRLNRGEMIMIHPAFKHAIKISFPHAAVKKP